MGSFLIFLLDLLFFIALFATIFVYLLYPIVLLVIGFFSHSTRKIDDISSVPGISIIVPTYNEANVIESKLVSLLGQSYPQNLYEIIVVDSGSSDGTCNIVKKFENRGVVLLQQEKRLGKSSAIHLALKKCEGEIIVLSDANSEFGPNALKKLVQRFGNGIGGVQPRIWLYGDAHERANTDLLDILWCRLHHIYKTLESNVDSLFFTSGKLFAFRKTLVPTIDEKAVADDLEIALGIRRRGHKIKYVPDMNVIERPATSRREKKIQRVRRAFGVLQAMRKNIILLFNPKYGSYGLVIFPTHFLRMALLPFFIFYLLIVIAIKMIQMVGSLDVTFQLLVGTFLCVFLSFLFLVKQFRKIALVGYDFLATQVFILLAIFDLVRGRSYRLWKKVSSTRDTSTLNL